MRDEREGRKKQARSNKQQGKATQHTQIHVHVYPYLFIVMNLWFGSLSLSAVTGIYDTLKSTTQKTKRTCFLTFGVGVYPDSLLVVVGLALIHVHCTCFEWESHVLCFFALLFVDLASFFLMQLSLKHVHCTCIRYFTWLYQSANNLDARTHTRTQCPCSLLTFPPFLGARISDGLVCTHNSDSSTSSFSLSRFLRMRVKF